jgi:hypothetical protein
MRDTFGIVPPEIKAMAEAEEAIERTVGTARFLDKALKAKDPNLGLVLVRDVPEWDLPVGAVPGRWHIQVKSEKFVTTYIPITGPKGEYREPDSSVLEIADRADLRKDDNYLRMIATQQRKQERKRKANELKGEQLLDDAVEDFKAAKRVAGDEGLKKRKWGRGSKVA